MRRIRNIEIGPSEREDANENTSVSSDLRERVETLPLGSESTGPRDFERRIRLHALYSLAVIGVGSLAMLGYAFELPWLSYLGHMSSASPLPLPFADPLGFQENFAYGVHYTIETPDGSRVEIESQRLAVSGPHRRRVVFARAVLFGAVQPGRVARQLQYAFCSVERPLLRGLGLSDPAKRVEIEVFARRPQLQFARRNVVECG